MIASNRLLALICLVLSVGAARNAQAGDGFPPFGAWAYGDVSSPSFARVRSFSTPFRSVSVARYGWYGHGYSRGRVSYRSFYGPRYRYRSVYRWPAVSTFSIASPYRYYSSLYAPAYIARPAVYYPLPFYYAAPLSYSSFFTPVISYQTPLCSVTKYEPSVASDLLEFSGNSGLSPIRREEGVVLAGGQSEVLADGKFVAVGNFPKSNVPTELLTAADALLQAGGYREAATAYAQLTTRYGVSSLLFGRRFIAQVLSGDADQAAVIALSARLSGFAIDRRDLPSASLRSLGIATQREEASVEMLAARAIDQPNDSASMEAVGRWLLLTGKDDRAAMFLSAARELEGENNGSIPNELELIDSRATPELASTGPLR